MNETGRDPLAEPACATVRERLLETLDTAIPADIETHLANCPGCRAEMATLQSAWEALEALPEGEPSAALGGRFHSWLGEQTLAGEARAKRGRQRRAWFGLSSGPRWVWAAAAVALVVGFGAGARLGRPSEKGELATLRVEVQTLNRLVSLSLLSQPAASDRLQGVAFGRDAAPDRSVTEALIDTLRHDENVNVRLAAVEALAGAARDAGIRERLVGALAEQQAPLVQIALTDVLLASEGAAARASLARILSAPASQRWDGTVREYLKKRLSESA
jgi:hypothetical protein